MKRLVLNSFVSSLVFFWVWFFVIKWFAALSTATSWTPLTAGNWNNMIPNFFGEVVADEYIIIEKFEYEQQLLLKN